MAVEPQVDPSRLAADVQARDLTRRVRSRRSYHTVVYLKIQHNAFTITGTFIKSGSMDGRDADQDQPALTSADAFSRMREWNRGPITDLFPRMPDVALETVLSKCSDKPFHYQLSQSKKWNARRLTAIVVAHVRHFNSEYDKLLRNGTERYEARRQTGPRVWKILREWCPFDADNEVLESCFQATQVPPSERDPTWDPMDLDIDSESEEISSSSHDDPMDLD